MPRQNVGGDLDLTTKIRNAQRLFRAQFGDSDGDDDDELDDDGGAQSNVGEW